MIYGSPSKNDFKRLIMKIVILNTAERTGGAAVAANRLMKALLKSGVEVTMLVRDRKTNDEHVVALNDSSWKRRLNLFRFIWERLIIFLCNKLSRKQLFQVSIANTGTDLSKHPVIQEADIIHLHWINQGFLSLTDIQRLIQTGKPIVWTLHDMWPCTAICHHALGCERFKTECKYCSFLSSHHENDIANRVFRAKQFLNESHIHLVAVSSWLQHHAKESALTCKLKADVIPNVIDTVLFHPSDKIEARKSLSLPLDKKIILMGAACIDNPIKGFPYLIEALSLLNKRDQGHLYHLVLFGNIKGDRSFLAELPITYTWMGLLNDSTTIATLYAAADVTVVSSLYETFGQTIIEGMACGCPAVSFNNSGQTDIISHQQNGYLARYKDTEDLANGIEWVLTHNRNNELSEACLQKVNTCYSESVIAEKYKNLYKQLICNNPHSQS